jgi:hypothetical protein
MLALLEDGKLFENNADAKDVMQRVLAKAAAYPEVYIARASDMGDLAVTHNKLGMAPLKPKMAVTAWSPNARSSSTIRQVDASRSCG